MVGRLSIANSALRPVSGIRYSDSCPRANTRRADCSREQTLSRPAWRLWCIPVHRRPLARLAHFATAIPRALNSQCPRRPPKVRCLSGAQHFRAQSRHHAGFHVKHLRPPFRIRCWSPPFGPLVLDYERRHSSSAVGPCGRRVPGPIGKGQLGRSRRDAHVQCVPRPGPSLRPAPKRPGCGRIGDSRRSFRDGEGECAKRLRGWAEIPPLRNQDQYDWRRQT